ncbi:MULTISPECIES: VUT family protein [unclassified Legionella]|uniref:VUT family protein n=1 Tax=unclassified Legionella TaxID=2622702 RepID=UPI001056767D|nr:MULTISPECIES: VUT family protein [unclassified Legionella]MDI9819531.1 VUT family protein [Legionella sp. PL877]
MTNLSTASQTRGTLLLAVGMMTCLILLINISFKIIMIQGMLFTASSILCPLVAIIYLLVLKECTILQQRHVLNQSLLALYLFSIGIYLLVNLPAAEYMHDNLAYQIVFEDIPKKFFASTLAFGLSFYLPHLLCCLKQKEILLTPKKRLLLATFGGFLFFTLDFFLLFSDPYVYNFKRIYFDSLMIAAGILLSVGIIYLTCLLFLKRPLLPTNKPLPSYLESPLYHYLVGFAVTIILICLACEYRLISFPNGWTLTASGLLFPLALIASNLVGELYGYKANLRLAVLLIVAELTFDLLLINLVALPSPEFFNLNPFYLFIMPRRIPAEALAVMVAFIDNAMLLEYLKKTTIGSSRFWRILIANTIVNSLLCLVNYSLLFGGIYEPIFNLAISAWSYKIASMLLSLPLVLWLYNLLSKKTYSQTLSQQG